MLGPPAEHVQWHVMLCTPVDQLGSCRPIEMDLPRHHREGGVIIRALARYPGKPVTAMYVTGGAGAKRRPAIAQGDLRYRSEDVLANRLERDDLREDQWRETGSHDVGDPPFGGHEAEYTIG